MGLKRFDYKLPGQHKNFKQVAIVLCICLITVLSFTSYALYQVNDQTQIAHSKVGEFHTSDVSLAILVDGEKKDAFPTKDSGKVFEKLECTNGGSGSWNADTWKLTINDITGPTECTVSFITNRGENAVSKITELASTNTTELFTDDTADQNIRYMGSDPANYVDIGNGNDADGNPILWRIIGVMNNIDDGTGKKETRIKLIREQSIGNLAWDSAGKNNWSTASLNTLLNNDYFNKQGDYTTTGFQTNVDNLVGDAVYHLGGLTSSNLQTLTASGYYEAERSNTVYSGNPTTWTGKVGLMYPSDYGYATSGGTNKNKEACAAKELYNWYLSDYADCKNNDWLFDSSKHQRTMTPYSSSARIAMSVNTNGYVDYDIVDYAIGIRPVLHLKSEVKITGGDGTKTNPYTLGA